MAAYTSFSRAHGLEPLFFNLPSLFRVGYHGSSLTSILGLPTHSILLLHDSCLLVDNVGLFRTSSLDLQEHIRVGFDTHNKEQIHNMIVL
jgi:hypothetical protein